MPRTKERRPPRRAARRGCFARNNQPAPPGRPRREGSREPRGDSDEKTQSPNNGSDIPGDRGEPPARKGHSDNGERGREHRENGRRGGEPRGNRGDEGCRRATGSYAGRRRGRSRRRGRPRYSSRRSYTPRGSARRPSPPVECLSPTPSKNPKAKRFAPAIRTQVDCTA